MVEWLRAYIGEWGSRENVTLGIALLGAGLGLFNTWRQVRREKVRLRVRPKAAYPIGPGGRGPEMICIEVVNLSSFAVTVSELGFSTGSFRKGRLVIAQPVFPDRGAWPRRLEARQGFSAYTYPHPDLWNVTGAFAKTDCGVAFKGNSPALKDIVRRITLAELERLKSLALAEGKA